MSSFKPGEIEEVLSDLAGEDRIAAEEIDFATLLAYHEDRLDDSTAESVRRALVIDPTLAQALLEIQSIGSSLDEDTTVSSERQQAAWKRLEEVLPANEVVATQQQPHTHAAPERPVDSTSKLGPLRLWIQRFPLASQGVAFALATLLSWFVLMPPFQSSQTSQVLYVVLDLIEDPQAMRSPQDRHKVFTVPVGTETITLCMTPPQRLSLNKDLPEKVSFILWQDQREKLVDSALLQDEDLYCIGLEDETLPPGTFRIKLRELGEKSDLATYSFGVSPSN